MRASGLMCASAVAVTADGPRPTPAPASPSASIAPTLPCGYMIANANAHTHVRDISYASQLLTCDTASCLRLHGGQQPRASTQWTKMRRRKKSPRVVERYVRRHRPMLVCRSRLLMPSRHPYSMAGSGARPNSRAALLLDPRRQCVRQEPACSAAPRLS